MYMADTLYDAGCGRIPFKYHAVITLHFRRHKIDTIYTCNSCFSISCQLLFVGLACAGFVPLYAHTSKYHTHIIRTQVENVGGTITLK